MIDPKELARLKALCEGVDFSDWDAIDLYNFHKMELPDAELVSAAVTALRAVFDSVLTFTERPPEWVMDNLFWWQVAGLTAVPLALLAGLLRAQLARQAGGDRQSVRDGLSERRGGVQGAAVMRPVPGGRARQG